MVLLRADGVLLRCLLRGSPGAGPVPRLASALRLAALSKAAAGAPFARFALGLDLVSPAASARLNRARRGVRGATDVLSFVSLLGARGGALPERGSPAAAADAANTDADADADADASGIAHAAEAIEDLGDLVVCPAVLARDAARDGVALEAHWRAVLVHGLVHLLGHDHERDEDALVMERREREVAEHLAELERAEPGGAAPPLFG
jgi:rRNA maturation RNase YbeY